MDRQAMMGGAGGMMPAGGAMPMMDRAMGQYNPQAAQAMGPDQAAQRAYADALSAGQGDPMIAATEAWKQAAQREADPSTPDAPGSENLRLIQQHLVQTKQLDPLTAWAIAHEALPRLGQQPPGGAPRG